jgi:hypothetical protein
MTTVELLNGILKGIGFRPTSFLLRWSPSFKNPFSFDLVEVMKCATDGGIVTKKSAQSSLGTHVGHHVKSPGRYGLFEFLLVQLRVIQ